MLGTPEGQANGTIPLGCKYINYVEPLLCLALEII